MKWEWSAFLVTFGTVFLAELGDKTQLATMNFAAKGHPLPAVFAGSAAALVISALLGTALGGALFEIVSPQVISKAAGTAFIVMGVLILWGKI